MNKQRRTALAKALPLLVEAQRLIAQARTIVEETRDDERSAYEGMSDAARGGDAGCDMEEALSELDDATSALECIDLGGIGKAVARVADRADPELERATMTETELHARRVARLAPWVAKLIADADTRAAASDARLAEAYGEEDEKNPKRILIDDYVSPTRGRTVPSEQILFAEAGIRVSTSDDGRSLEIHGVTMGVLTMSAQAANTMYVRLERRW